MSGHDFLAQDHGQELVVGDVLDHGDDDVTSLLEKGLVVPVWVDLGQLLGNQVVLTDKHGVGDGQDSLLVDSWVAGQEAVDVFAGTDATLIWFVELQRQQGLHSLVVKHRKHLQLATCKQKGLLTNATMATHLYTVQMS